MTIFYSMNPLASLSKRGYLLMATALLCLLCTMPAFASTPLRFALPAVQAGSVNLPERIYTVPTVAPQHVWDHVVIVKTKSAQHPNKGALSFQSLAWQNTLSPLAVRSIRAPYQREGVAIQEADPFGIERIFEVRYNLDIDPYDACALIAANPDVEYVTPSFKRYTLSTPNDPRFSSQYALAKIQAAQAWDITTGSSSIVIADVDSGVDFEHEDLAANLWNNPGEMGTDSKGRDKRTNGVDDDNDGYIDDYRGWDFVGSVTVAQLQSGTVLPDNDPKVRNSNIDLELNHGTATTGCICATTNNGKGVAAVGYQCKYLPIKCGSDVISNSILAGYEGIRYAVLMGAKIINCSWGGPGQSQSEQDIINDATAKGALVIAAAGNSTLNLDDSLQYPASFNNVLTVGATDANDKPSSFSNYGQRVDVWAPGSGILCVFSGNGYTTMDGTSFSCPIVAGIAGLIKTLHPDWTPHMIAHQLRSTCDNVITSLPAQRPRYYGRVNAYRAVNENRDLNTGTTPGLELSSMSFDGKADVESIGPIPAKFNIRNYLGRADNATITITPLSSGIKLSQTTFNVSRINATDSISLTCNISTASPTYFKSNSVECQVVMSAGSYTNYQTVTINVNIASENTYTSFASTKAVTYTGGYAKAPLVFWAVGKTTSGKHTVMHSTNIDSSLSDDLNCVWGLSTQSALVGSSSGRVLKTTNGATSWTPISVSNIAAKVLSINMSDASNGVLLGTPANGSWNVGITTDAGVTWTKGATISSAQSGETALPSSICWMGDYVWIGTSAGRVFYSSNRGSSWQSSNISGALVLTQVAFSSKLVGYAISRPSANVGDAATMYVTIDGGGNWAPSGVSFSTSALHPVYMYAPPASTQCVIVGSLSEVIMTTDTGRSFNPLITENGLSASAGFGLANSTTATLYILGKTVGILKFPLLNASGAGVLSTPANLEFDTLDVGAFVSKNVVAQNTGTAALSVTSATITPDAGVDASEFQLSGSVSNLNAGESASLFIKFTPAQAGSRKATLNIVSSVGSKSVTLHGVGRSKINDVSGVSDAASFLSVYPNPVASQALVQLQGMAGEQVEIEVLDMQGRLVHTIYSGTLDSDSRNFVLNVDELASGMYVCAVRSAKQCGRCAFVVHH